MICDVSLLGFWSGYCWFFLVLSPGVIGDVVRILFPVGINFLLVLGGLLFPFRLGVILHVGQSVYRDLWLVFSGFTNDGGSRGQQL